MRTSDGEHTGLRRQPPRWLGYVAAVLIQILVALALDLLRPLVPLANFPIPYVLATMVVAYVFDVGPAIVASLTGLLLFDYFSVRPTHTLWPMSLGPEGWAAYAAFLLGMVVVTIATVQARRSKQRIEERAVQLEAEIQQRRKTEDELSQVASLLQEHARLLDLAHVLIRGPEDRIVTWNSGAEELYGFSMHEAVGQVSHELLRTVFPVSKEACIEALRTDGHWEGELIHTAKDGRKIVVASHQVVHRDENGTVLATVEVNNDITEQRLAQETATRLAAIVESSDDAIIGKNLDGVITSWNNGAEHQYGYTQEEILGQHLSIIVPEDRRHEILRTLEMIQRGEPVRHYETERIAKDGARVPVSITASPIRNRLGIIVGASTISRDITEQKKAEEAIRRRTAVLDGIRRIFHEALTSETEEKLGAACLSIAEELTQSKFGFMGELNPDGLLDDLAISDPGWAQCQVTDPTTGHRWLPSALKVHGVYGRVMLDGKGFFTNDPASHPDSIGLPEGHPQLTAFLGVPLARGDTTVGMIAVGNREGGYRDEDLDTLESLAPAIVEALSRKRAEMALAESEDHYRSLFNLAPVGVVLNDDQGKIIAFNDQVCRQLGYTAEEFGKLDISEIDVDRASADVSRDLQNIRQAGAAEFEAHHRAKSGDVLDVMISTRPVRIGETAGFIAIWYDITDRKQAEAALAEARRHSEFLASVIERADQPVGIGFPDGKLGYVNAAFTRLVGYTAEELGAMDWMETLTPPEWKQLEAVRLGELARTGQPVRYEKEYLRKDGTRVPIELLVDAAKDDAGKVLHYMAFITDITERKQAEHEIRQLNAELEHRVIQRTAELENANKELEAFSYSVSHDLRAPLRAVDGFSDALLKYYRDSLDARGQDYLRRVRAAAQRMAQLIDDILGLSRAARAEMHRQRVDVSAMVSDILGAFQKSQPRRKAEVTVAPGLVIDADSHLIRIALDNLLGNAWKFTEKRDVASIEVGSLEQNGERVFFVKDNGAGFNPAYADKLFSAFQRLHPESEFAGTGIGLALVQRIVRRHGGRIWAESEVDKGATFYFTVGEAGE